METIRIEKQFESQKEMQDFVKNHLVDYTNGRTVLLVNSSVEAGEAKCVLESVTVL